MKKCVVIRVSETLVLALLMIVVAMAGPGHPANATSAGVSSASNAGFGADQSLALGQVSSSDQTEYTGQQIYISDEDALQRIAQTFGPEVATSLKHRATNTTQTYVRDDSIGFQEGTSTIWCGYQVNDPSANCVRGTFNVCKTSTTHALTGSWVGLGNSANGLIQTGYCMRQNPPYSYFKAWYELLPAGPVYINDFSIHTGDELGATVQSADGASTYFLCIFNETTGYYFASFFTYTPSPVCAEWIVETADTWKIGTWSGGPQSFWDAYWWNGPNPYAVTYGITQGAQFWHIKMDQGSPYYEHMTAYQDSNTSFHAQKTSS